MKRFKDLPLKVEAAFRSFLEELWKDVAPDELKGTPHKDVTFCIGMLQKCTQDLMMVMRHGFLEEVAKSSYKK